MSDCFLGVTILTLLAGAISDLALEAIKARMACDDLMNGVGINVILSSSIYDHDH